MAFTGFPKETFAFLAGLEKNNSKAWFEAHREDYEDYHLAPARAFVEAMAPGLKKISKTVDAEPRVNGSIFRINRDVRFSKDKSPYKTTLDLWFWEGEKRSWEAPGFFLRLTPTKAIAGAGMHQFTADQIKAYRKAIDDAKSGAALVKIIKGLGDLMLGEATRKTLPKGIATDHPRAALILIEGLHVLHEEKPPKAVHTAKFFDYCLDVFRRSAPVNQWLLRHVAGA